MNETRSDSGVIVGLGLPNSATREDDPVSWAQAAEELGYDFVSASDHPRGHHPSYETLAMLTWVAARTSRISVATRVLAVPFRYPAMVAKYAESLARLSGGRLILGLGAGYLNDEIESIGGTGLSPRDKVDGLAEAVQIIRGLWGNPEYSFHGRLHHVRALAIEPKPDRPIPVWLGAFGPRALAVTGRLADGWIPSLAHASPDQVPTMRARIDDAAIAAGRTPDQIRSIFNIGVRVDGSAGPQGDLVTGTSSQVIDQLRAFQQLGFSGFNFIPVGPDPATQVRTLAEEVIPALTETPA